jgi:hypothetical protein
MHAGFMGLLRQHFSDAVITVFGDMVLGDYRSAYIVGGDVIPDSVEGVAILLLALGEDRCSRLAAGMTGAFPTRWGEFVAEASWASWNQQNISPDLATPPRIGAPASQAMVVARRGGVVVPHRAQRRTHSAMVMSPSRGAPVSRTASPAESVVVREAVSAEFNRRAPAAVSSAAHQAAAMATNALSRDIHQVSGAVAARAAMEATQHVTASLNGAAPVIVEAASLGTVAHLAPWQRAFEMEMVTRLEQATLLMQQRIEATLQAGLSALQSTTAAPCPVPAAPRPPARSARRIEVDGGWSSAEGESGDERCVGGDDDDDDDSLSAEISRRLREGQRELSGGGRRGAGRSAAAASSSDGDEGLPSLSSPDALLQGRRSFRVWAQLGVGRKIDATLRFEDLWRAHVIDKVNAPRDEELARATLGRVLLVLKHGDRVPREMKRSILMDAIFITCSAAYGAKRAAGIAKSYKQDVLPKEFRRRVQTAALLEIGSSAPAAAAAAAAMRTAGLDAPPTKEIEAAALKRDSQPKRGRGRQGKGGGRADASAPQSQHPAEGGKKGQAGRRKDAGKDD